MYRDFGVGTVRSLNLFWKLSKNLFWGRIKSPNVAKLVAFSARSRHPELQDSEFDQTTTEFGNLGLTEAKVGGKELYMFITSSVKSFLRIRNSGVLFWWLLYCVFQVFSSS